MTRRTYRSAATVLAAFGVLSATPGCAAMLLGYVIADGISRNKATETCRANLKTTNEARIAKGLDVFPDTCGQ